MRHVIVGNGLAGITAAANLARRGEGEVEVYTSDSNHYYYRPRLTEFLGGKVPRESLYVHPPSWYEEKGIDVRLESRVTRVMPGDRRVALADGSEVPYDTLLLATGSRAVVPPIDGAGKKGVFTLHTLEDVLAIKEYADRCEEALVIGGGLLGLEVAMGLKCPGLGVRVLEFVPRLLPRQLDVEGADVLREILESRGVGVVLGVDARAVLGEGRVEGVVLKDGREFPAQMVVIAAGVIPNDALAADAGIAVSGGIVVDELMATDAPGVYAAGDAASFRGRSWGIIPVAAAQGLVAASNMAGERKIYDGVVPTHSLDISGITLTSVGKAVESKNGFREMRRAEPGAGIYKKLVLDGDALVGAIVIGDKPLARKLDGMVSRRAVVGKEELDGLLQVR